MKRLLIGAALAVMVAILMMSVGLSAQRSECPLPNGPSQISAGVVSPQSIYLGMSYGDWAAAWWQWASSLPVTNHPLNDVTGANAAVGQSGKVWFLGGLWWVSGGTPPVGPVTRKITVPAGTALFFPIANGENTFPEWPAAKNITELWASQDWSTWRDENLYATIDGKKLHELASYLTYSPLFKLWLPYEDNVLQAWGVPLIPGRGGVTIEQNGVGDDVYTIQPSAARGFFLMVEPLRVGKHRITFGVKDVGWNLDIVYNITVVPAT